MISTISAYKGCLRVIFDNTPIVPHTSKTAKNQPFTTLTPNYLCLQCPATTTAQNRIKHGNESMHRFCMRFASIDGDRGWQIVDVESRTGGLYCQMCDDFVWDPTLEELRMRKYGTGLFNGQYFISQFERLIGADLFCNSQETEAWWSFHRCCQGRPKIYFYEYCGSAMPCQWN